MRSIEKSKVNEWVYDQLKKTKQKYAIENGNIDPRIDSALAKGKSKQGGPGENVPDEKVLLDNGMTELPVMIENKGIIHRLLSSNSHGVPLIKDSNGKYLYKSNKNNGNEIDDFAVNGAIYYSKVVIKYSEFNNVLAVGINGYHDSPLSDHIIYQIAAYIVSNNTISKKVGNFSNLSFLNKHNQNALLTKIKHVQMNPIQLRMEKQRKSKKLTKVLKDLSNHLSGKGPKGKHHINHSLYKIPVQNRIFVVASSIMAALGVKDKNGQLIVAPRDPKDLSRPGASESDGQLIIDTDKKFLKYHNLPKDKLNEVIQSLKESVEDRNVDKPHHKSKITPLKVAYDEIYHDLIPKYREIISGDNNSIDFTGILFNVMTKWIDVPDGSNNNVVLTPRYITNLMAKLVKVNEDSKVWDLALGSGGFLISAMNLMIKDAKKNTRTKDSFENKCTDIREKQLLGVEIVPAIYVLAVLNMILMGDGSSNILNEDSINEFKGYALYPTKHKFKANRLLLNPPYSSDTAHGMIFLKKGLSMMNSGRAAIIVSETAGSGKASTINKDILKKNTLLASIKMPDDVFKGAKTYIYLFQVGQKHPKNQRVKFIDFSNDGYRRNKRNNSLRNAIPGPTASARYRDLVDVINNNGIDDSKYFFKENTLHHKKNYILDTIDVNNGGDWNFNQHIRINKQVTKNDLILTINRYLRNLHKIMTTDPINNNHLLMSMKQQYVSKELNHIINKFNQIKKINKVTYKSIPMSKLFTISKTPGSGAINKYNLYHDDDSYDYVTRTSKNYGVEEKTGFIDDNHLNNSGEFSLGLLQDTFYYRPREWYAGQYVRKICPTTKVSLNHWTILYFKALFDKIRPLILPPVLIRNVNDIFSNMIVKVPISNNTVDINYIDELVMKYEIRYYKRLLNCINKELGKNFNK